MVRFENFKKLTSSWQLARPAGQAGAKTCATWGLETCGCLEREDGLYFQHCIYHFKDKSLWRESLSLKLWQHDKIKVLWKCPSDHAPPVLYISQSVWPNDVNLWRQYRPSVNIWGQTSPLCTMVHDTGRWCTTVHNASWWCTAYVGAAQPSPVPLSWYIM